MLTWVEISKQNLLYNVAELRKAIGKAQFLAVVKANAYGHGMLEVAQAIRNRVDWFGVVSLSEALALRESGIANSLLVLSYYEEDERVLAQAIKQRVSLPVYRLEQLRLLEKIARRTGQQARVHLKIDTGTSRMGFFPEEIVKFKEVLQSCSHVVPEGIFSHFADSEDNEVYTKQQLAAFERAVAVFSGHAALVRHIACSAASLLHKEARLDLVRMGIMLYGLHPSRKTELAPLPAGEFRNMISLKPVLSWKSKVVQVKALPAGTYVGYGLSFRTARKTVMAVLPVGYAEGYDRKLSNSGEVLLGGRRAPVLGRICMNLMMVDATGIPVAVGDEAVLIGRQRNNEITATDIAVKSGTINHEVITRINWSLPRVIIS